MTEPPDSSVIPLDLSTDPRSASDSPAPQPAGAIRSVFSTLVASTPKYEFQGLAWAWSLLQAGIPPERIVVHHTPSLSASFKSALAELGVTTKEVPAHPSGHPHCNKVQQLLDGLWPSSELIALCDADLIWLDPHCLPRVQFAAKLVDRPNPPEERWRKLLQEAGFAPVLVPVDLTDSPQERTPSTNFNGGLYLLEAGLADELGRAWDERVGWLAGRETSSKVAAHRDQVALALALALLDLGVVPVHLDRGWNFPTHKDARLLSRPIVHIRALHHRDRRDQVGRLLPVGVDWIDDAVARANELVDSMLRVFAAHPVLEGQPRLAQTGPL